MIRVRWKLKQYLKDHQLTAYQLWKVSGLSRTGLYNLVTPRGLNRAAGVEFDTLGKLIGGLEKLTGKRVELSDVLEVVRDVRKPALSDDQGG